MSEKTKKQERETQRNLDEFVLDEKLIDIYGKRTGNIYTKISNKRTYDGFPRLSEYPTYNDLSNSEGSQNNWPEITHEKQSLKKIQPTNQSPKSQSRKKEKKRKPSIILQNSKKRKSVRFSEKLSEFEYSISSYNMTTKQQKEKSQEKMPSLEQKRARLESLKNLTKVEQAEIKQISEKQSLQLHNIEDINFQYTTKQQLNLEKIKNELQEYVNQEIKKEKAQKKNNKKKKNKRKASKSLQNKKKTSNLQRVEQQSLTVAEDKDKSLVKIKRKKQKNSEEKERYPRRKRVTPLAFWKGERVQYRKNNINLIQNNNFFDLIKAKPSGCQAFVLYNIEDEKIRGNISIPSKQKLQCYGFSKPYTKLIIDGTTGKNNLILQYEGSEKKIKKNDHLEISQNTPFEIHNPFRSWKKFTLTLFKE